MEVKKRKRTSYSCTLCRSRKIKCDRRKPVCGRCIRGKTASQCIYGTAPLWLEAEEVPKTYMEASEVPVGLVEPNWVKPEPQNRDRTLRKLASLEAKAAELREALWGSTPKGDKTSVDLVPRQGHLGATTWFALANSDPFLRHMLEDYKLQKETEKLKDTIAGRKRRRPVIGPGSAILERQIDFKKEVAPTNVSGDLGSIAAAILQVMPSKDVVYPLTAHFFKYVAPFFPVLDEHSFVDSINRTLNYQTDGSLAVLMETKSNVVTVGNLLIILRMAYLNIYLKAQTHISLTTTETMLLSHPIEANVISTVQLIMEYARYLRKPSLEMLQLLILLRQYFKYAPEDGDGGDGSDSTVLMGLVVSAAVATGTNRELKGDFSERYKLQWRKVWWYVVMMDIDESITVGLLPKVHEEDSDTRLPEFSAVNANFADSGLEEETIRLMRRRVSFHPELRRILKLAFGVNSNPTVSSLNREICSLDALMSRLVDPNLPLSSGKTRCTDNKLLSMEIGRFLLALEHHLLLHNEKTGDVPGFFTMAMAVINRTLRLLQMTMEVFKLLFDQLADYNLTLTQLCLTTLMRLSQFFVFALVRIRLLEYKVKQNEITLSSECQGLFVELSKRLYSRLNTLNGVLYLVSDTYYGGFKAYSYVSFMLECLKGNAYFATNKIRVSKNGFEWLNASQLKQMITAIDVVKIDDPKEFAINSFATHSKTPRSPEPYEEVWDSDPGILEFLGAFKEEFEIPNFVEPHVK